MLKETIFTGGAAMSKEKDRTNLKFLNGDCLVVEKMIQDRKFKDEAVLVASRILNRKKEKDPTNFKFLNGGCLVV